MNLLSAQTASSDFLTLLTIQLRNQDPINPVDQQNLLNDLTQFSILEGIQNLNASFEEVRQLQELSQSLGLVGKQIQFIDPITGSTNSGIVQQLITSQKSIRIAVNDQTIGLNQIVSVGNPVA